LDGFSAQTLSPSAAFPVPEHFPPLPSESVDVRPPHGDAVSTPIVPLAAPSPQPAQEESSASHSLGVSAH
jgi:hypothetical protein